MVCVCGSKKEEFIFGSFDSKLEKLAEIIMENAFERMTKIENAYSATNPVTTTKKSIMFQIFLRYEFLCITKPKARIFSDASTQKMARKYTSVFSLKEIEHRLCRDRKQPLVELDLPV